LGLSPAWSLGIAVLDIDERNGGDASLLALDDAGLWLPDDGPVGLSGSRASLHYYFKVDRHLKKSVPFPGVELQADGALVVAVPSVHAATARPYTWIRSPFECPLPPLPEWLVAAACEVASPMPVPAAPLPTAREDDLVTACAAAGLYRRRHRRLGWHVVICPWANEHSDPRAAEATVMEPGTTAAAGWAFKCLHMHCADRHIGELLDYLAIPRRGA
jgi:hypothetical protein